MTLNIVFIYSLMTEVYIYERTLFKIIFLILLGGTKAIFRFFNLCSQMKEDIKSIPKR